MRIPAMYQRFALFYVVILSCLTDLPNVMTQDNIARGKPTNQTGVWGSAASSRAVDGYFFWPNCSLTNVSEGQPGQWWVDLEDSYRVTGVKLYNTPTHSGGESRLTDVVVSVGPSLSGLQECGRHEGQVSRSTTPATFSCDIVGRFVHITRFGGSRIHQLLLCEVEVTRGRPYVRPERVSETMAVSDLTAYSIRVTWQQLTSIPADYASYYGYEVRYKTDSDITYSVGPEVDHTSATDNSVVLGNLQPNTQYMIRVVPYSRHYGETMEGSPYPSVTAITACGSPDPPENVVAYIIPFSNQTILLITWDDVTSLSSQCDMMTAIRLEYRLDDDREWVTVSVPMTNSNYRVNLSAGDNPQQIRLVTVNDADMETGSEAQLVITDVKYVDTEQLVIIVSAIVAALVVVAISVIVTSILVIRYRRSQHSAAQNAHNQSSQPSGDTEGRSVERDPSMTAGYDNMQLETQNHEIAVYDEIRNGISHSQQ